MDDTVWIRDNKKRTAHTGSGGTTPALHRRGCGRRVANGRLLSTFS